MLCTVGVERADLYAQAGAPPVSAKANVVVMGQDEFHDALESAAESASIASTSDGQDDSGQDSIAHKQHSWLALCLATSASVPDVMPVFV